MMTLFPFVFSLVFVFFSSSSTLYFISVTSLASSPCDYFPFFFFTFSSYLISVGYLIFPWVLRCIFSFLALLLIISSPFQSLPPFVLKITSYLFPVRSSPSFAPRKYSVSFTLQFYFHSYLYNHGLRELL